MQNVYLLYFIIIMYKHIHNSIHIITTDDHKDL